MTPPLRQLPKAGLPLQASKWLDIPMLLDTDEMKKLLDELGDIFIVLTNGVVKKGEGFLSKEEFLDCYDAYVSALKNGLMPSDPRIRPYFSVAITNYLDPLYVINIDEHRQIIKADKPVLQMQQHRFSYSPADGKFHSMVFGQDNILWGVQFSYPQLFQDDNYQVKSVRETSEFPNTALFKKLQRWSRSHTIATPFLIDNQLINAPIRLGKSCLPWINLHPQLVKLQFGVRP